MISAEVVDNVLITCDIAARVTVDILHPVPQPLWTEMKQFDKVPNISIKSYKLVYLERGLEIIHF